MDSGYLSRILQRFERDGLITRAASATDRRQSPLSLTMAGREAFAPLDARSREEVGALLADLTEPAQASLVAAMGQIETLLGARHAAPWLLRQHRPGDIGWVVARHGALYAEEYGLDHRFEALVAQVAGEFLARHDPARERCWIAERDGVNVGSVFLVRKSDEVAKLRLLIVEPAARGLGIGQRLVTECVSFARAAGYRGITLWTNDVLVAARAIYQQAGFHLVASAPHRDFGPPMVGEDWELSLIVTVDPSIIQSIVLRQSTDRARAASRTSDAWQTTARPGGRAGSPLRSTHPPCHSSSAPQAVPANA